MTLNCFVFDFLDLDNFVRALQQENAEKSGANKSDDAKVEPKKDDDDEMALD